LQWRKPPLHRPPISIKYIGYASENDVSTARSKTNNTTGTISSWKAASSKG
jgi:hypothetical protein